MAAWTRKVLEWSGSMQVFRGVPACDDEGGRYHYPRVENLENSLLGIHAALSDYIRLPDSYGGIAIYSDWEMQPDE
jgi:hypothetical protein